MSIEENFVRQQAIEAYKLILKKLAKEVVENLVFPLYVKFFDTVWFSKKVSACMLLEFMMELVSNDLKLTLLE